MRAENQQQKSTKCRFVVLISGRGSNMRAIVEKAGPQTEVLAVIAHTKESQGLSWAKERGIDAHEIRHRHYASRAEHEAALIECIDRYQPDYVLLAGFMRILSADFVAHYADRLINIHPSILPAFVGLDTHEKAIEMGVLVHGCTVHGVTSELDCGPILGQAMVPVLPDDTADALAARVLRQEHTVFPAVVNALAEGRLGLKDNRVVGQPLRAVDPDLVSSGL